MVTGITITMVNMSVNTNIGTTIKTAQAKANMMTPGPNNPIPVDPDNDATHTPEYTRNEVIITGIEERMVSAVDTLEAAR